MTDITYTMSEPRPGFVNGVFTPDNWNDPTLNFIRDGLESGTPKSIMWSGKTLENVDVGYTIEPWRATFHCSEVKTSFGSGLVYAGILVDQNYALVYIEAKTQWFYISWYKRRGATEAVYYAKENKDEFSLGKPVTYKGAIFLGYFLNTIQKKRPAYKAKINRIYTHEEEHYQAVARGEE